MSYLRPLHLDLVWLFAKIWQLASTTFEASPLKTSDLATSGHSKTYLVILVRYYYVLLSKPILTCLH
jgi:hypothetical protein